MKSSSPAAAAIERQQEQAISTSSDEPIANNLYGSQTTSVTKDSPSLSADGDVGDNGTPTSKGTDITNDMSKEQSKARARAKKPVAQAAPTTGVITSSVDKETTDAQIASETRTRARSTNRAVVAENIATTDISGSTSTATDRISEKAPRTKESSGRGSSGKQSKGALQVRGGDDDDQLRAQGDKPAATEATGAKARETEAVTGAASAAVRVYKPRARGLH
jgi:hypothetical protein